MLTKRTFFLLLLGIAVGNLFSGSAKKVLITTQNRCFITYRHEWLHYSLAVISGIEIAAFKMLVNESALAYYSSASSTHESGDTSGSIYDRFLSQSEYFIRQSDLTSFKTLSALQAGREESSVQTNLKSKDIYYGTTMKSSSDYEVSALESHSVSTSLADSNIQKSTSESAYAKSEGISSEVIASEIGYSDKKNVSGDTDISEVASFDRMTKSEARELLGKISGNVNNAQRFNREEISGVAEFSLQTESSGSALEIQQISHSDIIHSVSNENLSSSLADSKLSGQQVYFQQTTSLGYAQIPRLEFKKKFIAYNKENISEDTEYEFSIEISNTGDLDLYDVNVYDVLPEGLEVASFKTISTTNTNMKDIVFKRKDNVFTIAKFLIGQSIIIDYTCRVRG